MLCFYVVYDLFCWTCLIFVIRKQKFLEIVSNRPGCSRFFCGRRRLLLLVALLMILLIAVINFQIWIRTLHLLVFFLFKFVRGVYYFWRSLFFFFWLFKLSNLYMMMEIIDHYLIFGISGNPQWNKTTFWKFRMLVTIKTSVTHAFVWTEHPTLIAFAILLLAARFLASASFWMRAGVFRYLWFECLRVSLKYGLHGSFPLFIAICVAAILAVAVWATSKT